MELLNVGDLPDGALLLVDTPPIIYPFENHARLAPLLRPILDAYAAGRLRFRGHDGHHRRAADRPSHAADEALARPCGAVLESWQHTALDVDIAESAARLRATLRLKLADAAQAASALAINAAALVTHDRDFSRVPALHVIAHHFVRDSLLASALPLQP